MPDARAQRVGGNRVKRSGMNGSWQLPSYCATSAATSTGCPFRTDRLTHWQTDAASLVRFIAGCPFVERKRPTADRRGTSWKPAWFAGGVAAEWWGLRMEDELKFVAGSSELPFSEVLRFREDRYGLEETPHPPLAGRGHRRGVSLQREPDQVRVKKARHPQKGSGSAEGLPVAETGEAGQAGRLVRAADRQERARRRTQRGNHPQADEKKVKNGAKKLGKFKSFCFFLPN